MNEKKQLILLVTVASFITIVGIVCFSYEFTHPEKTRMQLCFDLWNGNLWKWVFTRA